MYRLSCFALFACSLVAQTVTHPALVPGVNQLTFPVVGTPILYTDGVPSTTLGNPDFSLVSNACTAASCTVSVQFTPQFAGVRRGAVKMLDTSNNVLTTGFLYGVGAITPTFTAGIQSVLVSGLSFPLGVAVDGAGNVYSSNKGAGTVTESNANGLPVKTITGLSSPWGIAMDGAGDLYISEAGKADIVKVLPGASTFTTFASGFNGTNSPQGLTTDVAGNVYVADTLNNRIVEISPAGTAAPVNTGSYSLAYPAGMALDAAGNLFIADWGNGRIIEVPVTGAANTKVYASGFKNPSSIGVDDAGNFFVTDDTANALYEIPAGSTTATAIGSGFNTDYSVAVSGAGNLYVADAGNGRIVEIQRAPTNNIIFSAIATQTVGTNLTLSATATSGLPVTFTSSTAAICSVSGNSAALVNAGVCTIAASQSGNSTYPAAVPVSQSFGVAGPAPAPTAVSVTPASGSGTSQTFTATFSDLNVPIGAAGLNAVYLLFNSSVSSVGGCYVQYYPSSGLLFLRNDAGTAYASPASGAALGSAATLANSQCSISAAGASYNLSGSTATLSVPVTFSATTATNVYLFASERNGTNTGWVQKGTWGTKQPPTVTSVSPASGAGAAQAFTVTVSDPNGATNVNAVFLLLNSSLAKASGCYVEYFPISKLLYLKDDTGNLLSAGIALGSTGTVSNSQCTLLATGSGYHVAGNIATLLVNLTFNQNAKVNLYAYASDVNGLNTGWMPEGTWLPAKFQSITFTSIPPQKAGTTLALNATANSNLGVTLTSSTPGVCTISGSTATFFSGGTCSLTASQSGSTTYAAATPVTQSFTVVGPTLSPFTLPSGTAQCASDGGVCTLPAGATATVAYGAGTASNYFFQPGVTGSIACTPAAFGGDPDPNVVKACYAVVTSTLKGIAECAASGGTCNVPPSVPATVYYGAGGSYFFAQGVTGSIACTTSVFGGDPVPNVVKACYVSTFSFTHPGISHSQADLDRMKSNINVEPYRTAYLAFAADGHSSYTNAGQGPFTYETYNHGQFEIRNDAQVVHQNAVMWYITQNPAYMQNAINIMMGWANTLTQFDQTDYISAATAIEDFSDGAEIIKATGGGAWAAADVATFQNWMLTYLYPPLLSPGNTLDPKLGVLQGASAGGIQIAALFSIGILTDRQDIFNFAVASYQHNGTYSYGLQEYIDPVSFQNYQNQEDIGHSSGELGTKTEDCYKAWNQGADLFSLQNNLLAHALEAQAKFDEGWDVVPAGWTAKDGSYHHSLEGRYGFGPQSDNLVSDMAYHHYHDIEGLEMPYTKLSADSKYPGNALYYRVDNSGQVPLAPILGAPAATQVMIYDDGYDGSYIGTFGPGSYTFQGLEAGGVLPYGSTPTYNGFQGGLGASSMKVPLGWTVVSYSGPNFNGTSFTFTATPQNGGINNFVTTAFNDSINSIVVTAGKTPYAVSSSTYRIVNSGSGLSLDGNAAGGLGQQPYTGASSQLWRVEALGNGAYKILNIGSNKALEDPGFSATAGTLIDQQPYVVPPDVATGGSASATADDASSGEGAAQAFDGNVNTKVSGPFNTAILLQYQLTVAKAVTEYQITSANDVPQRDPAAWQFQASNDGAAWVTLDTQSGQVFASRFQTNSYFISNNTAYLYYRLNITAIAAGPAPQPNYIYQLAELVLISNVGPANIAIGGVASTNATGNAAQAFDGSTATKWSGAFTGVTYLQYQLSSAQIVNQYQISSANDIPQSDPAAWLFQGSNDGLTWTTLDTQSGQAFANRLQTNSYSIVNATPYQYYRLYVTATAAGATQTVYGIQLSELALVSYTGSNLNQNWLFNSVSGSAFSIANQFDSQVLSPAGAALSQSPNTGAGAQQWILQVP